MIAAGASVLIRTIALNTSKPLSTERRWAVAVAQLALHEAEMK